MGKTIPWVRWTVVFVGLVTVTACGGSGGGPDGEIGYAGTYQVTVGPDPKFTMTLAGAGGTYAFEIHGAEVPIAGTGTESGGAMELAADLVGMGQFTAELAFAAPGSAFTGMWELADAPASGTMTGSRDPWPTWDLDQAGIPQIATSDCIELDKILRLSRFRSGAGHDYSDDFESCRSMKHYFHPKSGVDISTIRVYAPFSGTVVGTTEEWDGPALWKGTAVGIRPDGYPAFHVVLFHVDLHTPLAIGDTVAAGQEIGTSEKEDGTAADVAIGVMTPTGFCLVSFFEVMTDDVFAAYAARGVTARADMIVTRAQRDADPLTCDGQAFQSASSLPDWVDLN